MKAGWDINEIYAVQGAQMSCQWWADKTSRACSEEFLSLFQPPAQPWHCFRDTPWRGERIPWGNSGKQLTGAFCAGTCRSRACTCTSGAGRDLPLHQHSAFYKSNPGLPKSDLFFSSGLVHSVQQGSKSFQKLSSDPAGLKWPSPLPRLQYS